MKFSGVTILQGVEFPIFLLIFTWALQQQRYCAACIADYWPFFLLLTDVALVNTPVWGKPLERSALEALRLCAI